MILQWAGMTNDPRLVPIQEVVTERASQSTGEAEKNIIIKHLKGSSFIDRVKTKDKRVNFQFPFLYKDDVQEWSSN